MVETWDWPELAGVQPLEDFELTAWPPDAAERAFMDRFADLDGRRGAC
jgi:hypothetical protein